MMVLKRTTDVKLIAELNQPVQTLHHKLYPDLFIAYDQSAMEAYFEMSIAAPEFYYIVAYLEALPVGFVCFEEKRTTENFIAREAHKLYVHQLSVNEGHRGKGIGKLLMAYVKTYAEAQKVHRIELEYWVKNEGAAQFYKKQGFENSYNNASRVVCKAEINYEEVGQ